MQIRIWEKRDNPGWTHAWQRRKTGPTENKLNEGGMEERASTLRNFSMDRSSCRAPLFFLSLVFSSLSPACARLFFSLLSPFFLSFFSFFLIFFPSFLFIRERGMKVAEDAHFRRACCRCSFNRQFEFTPPAQSTLLPARRDDEPRYVSAISNPCYPFL